MNVISIHIFKAEVYRSRVGHELETQLSQHSQRLIQNAQDFQSMPTSNSEVEGKYLYFEHKFPMFLLLLLTWTGTKVINVSVNIKRINCNLSIK